MSIVLAVLEIVAPVFILAIIGFVWVKIGSEYRVAFVTKLAMTISVPCLIFTSLMKTKIDPAAMTELVVATIVAYGGLTIAMFFLVKTTRLDTQTFLAPLIFGNTGNLGLPLSLFAFGQVGLGYAVVVFAIMAIYSFTFGIWLVSGGGAPLKAIKEPMVWATVLGAVFLYYDWETPNWLTNTLDLIGQMAIPLMLITLGVAVARLHPRGLSRAILLSVAKVLMSVGVAVLVGYYFQLAKVPFAVLVLQISTPVAVTSYLLAQKYEADAESVAGFVVVSTLISVLSLPILLAFLL